ncbi:MAG: hypothetical protein Q9173_003799 [Seirophora scorigena]
MPVIQFGGGNVGEGAFATVEDVVALLDTLDACGIKEIDTAGVYPISSFGASERLLGAANAPNRGFIVNTKIMVTGEGPGQGSLRKKAIDESLRRSLTTLCVPNVRSCWIATPPYLQIGLSKYSVSQVEEFLSKCDMHGWKKPTVYQGQYNAICRGMEMDLLPLLRRHGIAYVAFRSPLAGGFLTANFSLGNDLQGTRFAEGHAIGRHYRPMYDKPALHAAIRELHAFLQPRGMTMVEAALRWVFHHSSLGPQDAVILGATKRVQIERNVSQIQKGPLAEEIVEMFDKTWDRVRESAP